MPGLPAARAAGAEALVLRAAERSLMDVLELVKTGALDPSTLGSLSGLCEELKRTSVPRVVDAVPEAPDDDEADTEKEEDPGPGPSGFRAAAAGHLARGLLDPRFVWRRRRPRGMTQMLYRGAGASYRPSRGRYGPHRSTWRRRRRRRRCLLGGRR